MDRRKLLSWFGLGWLVSLLPSSLLGCSDSTPSNTSSSPAKSAPESLAAAPSGNFKAIGTVAQLDKDGSLVSSDKKIAVVRDPKDKTKLLAVNTTCTHKSCVVLWKSDKKQYVCPCHDAEFAADGAVIGGPAKKPLPTYAAKIEKDQVVVSA
jgi:cytochrome b6-f complex iron-sulfur subunit